MLEIFKIRLVRSALRCVLPFIDHGDFDRRLRGLDSQDEKHEGFDLRPWTYERVQSSNSNDTHRYYWLPCSREDAPTMVFLHGLNLDGRNFLGMTSLSKEVNLIAYDFPEKSDRYGKDIDDFTTLLDDFLDVIGLDGIHLCGVSFGGIVALRFAAQRASRVQTLALISTRINEYSEWEKVRSLVIDEMLDSYRDSEIYWILERLKGRHFHGLSSEERSRTESMLRMKDPGWFRQVFGSLAGYEARQDALAVGCPTLVLLGTKDTLMPMSSLDEFRATLRDGELHAIRGGEHDMSLNDPEMVSEHLLRHLAG
jgi:3-oxoadipate enol-lactonase